MYQNDEHMYDAMLDLAAGRLRDPEAVALRRHIEADATLAEEYSGLAVLVLDLESYGESLTADLPEIDVYDSVLSRVRSLGSEESRIVPIVQHTRPWRRIAPWAVAAAVAAGVIAAVWIGLMDAEPSISNDVAGNSGSTDDPFKDTAPPEPSDDESRVAIAPPTYRPGESGPEVQVPDSTGQRTALAKDDVIEKRRSAAKDDEAREVLARWAALSPENVRDILADPDASDDAIVGAALALGGSEAVPYLQQAVERNPDDAYLNLELAQAAGTAPNPELDADNALGWYVYARHLLSSDPPNLPEALRALETAEGYSKAHAYALESAQYHEDALIASGVPEDSAHLLTAFTTGPSEREDMLALGNDLLAYAEYFQELGDSGAAQTIVEAVQRFGEQLNNGALFSHERFAGLELQDAALQALETMYAGSNISSLVRDMEAVAAGFDGLVAFIGNLNELLSRALPDNLWEFIADIILQQGDLQIFNNLPSFGE